MLPPNAFAELNKLSDKVAEALENVVFAPIGKLVTEYTMLDGTKVRDEIDLETGNIARYMQPIIPAKYIRMNIIITRDGVVINRDETLITKEKDKNTKHLECMEQLKARLQYKLEES